jgi:putative hydrolase of the HAD superfamily
VFLDAGDTMLSPWPSFHARFVQVAEAEGERFEQAGVEAALAGALRDAAWPDDWDPAATRSFWERLYDGVLGLLGHAGDRDRLVRVMYDTFSDPATYKLFPGVRQTLDTLAGRGLVLGVVSNFEPWLLDILELEGVRDRFATIAVSGVLGVAKPDPAIFAAALTDAGVEAADTIHVGDSPAADVDGARAAGITPVWLATPGRAAPPDTPSITSLTELPSLLA